jgi:hypothetical protein
VDQRNTQRNLAAQVAQRAQERTSRIQQQEAVDPTADHETMMRERAEVERAARAEGITEEVRAQRVAQEEENRRRAANNGNTRVRPNRRRQNAVTPGSAFCADP